MQVGELAHRRVADEPGGPELLVEPSDHPALGPYRWALVADGIPAALLTVGDVGAEYEKLAKRGVRFAQKPSMQVR